MLNNEDLSAVAWFIAFSVYLSPLPIVSTASPYEVLMFGYARVAVY